MHMLVNVKQVGASVLVIIVLSMMSFKLLADGPMGRLSVPEFVSCDRNKLTSWQGQVIEYVHQDTDLSITIKTDYDTVEKVTLSLPTIEAMTNQLRINGHVFEASHWALLENKQGQPVGQPRVIAWVCEEPKHILLDWHL